MMDFVKEFNANAKNGAELAHPRRAHGLREPHVFLSPNARPPGVLFSKKALGIDKGAQNPGDEVVGTLNMDQVAAIAEVKKGGARHEHSVRRFV